MGVGLREGVVLDRAGIRSANWAGLVEWLALLALAAGVVLLYPDAVVTFRDFALREPDNRHHTFPFFAHWIDSLRSYGSLDPWNPYVWGGTPAIGQPSVPLNPILYGLLHLSRPHFVWAMNLHAGLELWLAAIGLYLVLRHLGFPVWRATLGGFLYTASTSATVTIAFYGTFFHFVAFPWVLWILFTAERRSFWKSTFWLAAIFYFQLTYGQLQFTQYLIVLLSLCVGWLFRETVADRGRAMKCLAVGFLLGGLLAAHHLIPFLEYVRLVPDRVATDWWAFSEADRSSWRYLIHLVVPELFWDPAGWWPSGWGVWESLTVYVGTVYSLLFLFSFRSLWVPGFDPPHHRRWIIFAILLALLCTTRLGGLAFIALHGGREIPFGRAGHLLLIPLVFCSLSELGAILEDRRRASAFFLFLAVAVAGLMVLRWPAVLRVYTASFFREASTRDPNILSWFDWFWGTHHVRFTGYLSQKIVEVAAAGILVFLLAWSPDRSWLRRFAGFSLVVGSVLVTVNFHRWARPRGTDPYPYAASLAKENPILNFLRRSDRERYFFHYFIGDRDPHIGLTPNENGTYGVPSINGYTNLVPRRSEVEPRLYRVNFGQNYSDSQLRLLSVRYSLVRDDRLPDSFAKRMREVVRFPPYRLLEFPGALPRFYFPRRILWADRASVVDAMARPDGDPGALSFAVGSRDEYRLPDRCSPRVDIVGRHLSERTLRVDNPCPAPVYLSLHMPQHPWWRVYRDGRPVTYEEANVLHRLVEIPPGVHVLDLKCVPVSWWAGILLSLVTLLAALTVWLRSRHV